MTSEKPVKKEDVHARKLGDEWLLYDSQSEKVHILNPTAEYVWRLCDGNHDLEAIKAKLREAYEDINDEQLQSDLDQIIEEFEQIGVLQES
jgi:Coenzyme PQQ synthesis protein D (PqqD)